MSMIPDLLEDTAEGYVLTASDRCDSCGAQAYVSAEMSTGTLLFCGHHWRDYGAKISESALNIRDETSKLLS